MTNEEFQNVYLTATLKAVRNVIDANLDGKGLQVTANDLSDQEVYNILIAGSQADDVKGFAKECVGVNKKVFPSYDFLHKPGSQYVQCFKQLWAFCQKYRSFFVIKKEEPNDKKEETAVRAGSK